MKRLKLFLLLLLGTGCSSEQEEDILRQRHQKGEYIYRNHNEFLTTISSPEKTSPKIYPWNQQLSNRYPKITKDYFRCKGSCLNQVHIYKNKEEETVRQYDCGGSSKHSLPLKDGKEFIYPILIELVNYIQDQTERCIVITSGHRCPEHNTYIDPAPSNQYSKHMIGAEVSFYVQGMEEHPEQIVKLIQLFYQKNAFYQGKKEYVTFQRYDKKTDVSTLPWFNKEIFIKLYEKKEGRNFDNRHPYPYLSIQVRHDRDSNEQVTYSWDKAFRNYHRW
jgi:hypothetical protein